MTISNVVMSQPRPARRARLVPPLINGDQLNRHEFERRYEAMPTVKKAELIEGVVYMPSPVHYEGHSEPHAFIITWLGNYSVATPGVRPADNSTVRLDADNEVQPDAFLRLDQSRGGKSRTSHDDYVEGPPELIVEVAASSASIDLRDKLKVYRRNGVQECIVWQVYEDQLDWFQLIDDGLQPLEPDEAGASRSRVFPGLWLHVPALLDGDLAKVLAQLQIGLNSTEHADFLTRLAPKSP